MNDIKLIITCEHAGNKIPLIFRSLFKRAGADLISHRGWDPGAKELAKKLALYFDLDPVMTDYSRLLIEVNRSLDHPDLFSEYTKGLSTPVKKLIIKYYYLPYRNRVENIIRSYIKDGHKVLHLSVHTFTPIWEGQYRLVDIGILFDEGSVTELKFSDAWQQELSHKSSLLKIKLNEPYNGASDGFTTYLRTQFSGDRYLGLELEVSQRFYKSSDFEDISKMVCESLKKQLVCLLPASE